MQHWAEEIPKYESADRGARITLWSGQLDGRTGLAPPPNSWAANPQNEVGVVLMDLAPGATYTVPAASGGTAVNRMAYFIEGDALEVNEQRVKEHSALTLKADTDAVFTNPHGGTRTEVLILQGRPINEPVAQHGPFVMNTDEEIRQAFADYRKTQFGGWPWPQDAMVFPRTKGRFALAGGLESRPPVAGISDGTKNEL